MLMQEGVGCVTLGLGEMENQGVRESEIEFRII